MRAHEIFPKQHSLTAPHGTLLFVRGWDFHSSLMSVLSLYFYFWYIIDDFTKKTEFFLPKSDHLIHLLISIVNNKCKYPWLCFPLIEASFSRRKLMIRQKKRNFIYPAAPVYWIFSWNLFITIRKIIFRVWIVIEHWFQSTKWKKTRWKELSGSKI